MPERAKRPDKDRADDRASAVDAVDDLREVIQLNRAAIESLPAAGQRTPEQRKDALQHRSVIAVARVQLLMLGVATDQERARGPK